MSSNVNYSRLIVVLGLSLTTLLIAASVRAECIKDLRGEVYCGAGRCVVDSKGVVWCSRTLHGDAKISLDGQVLCGKGDCVAGRDGKLYCSSEIGGDVLVDSRGLVRCFGQCEAATAEYCESKKADSAEE